MPWGDTWGSTPCSNSLHLAKAFNEGRELGSVKSGTYVAYEEHTQLLVYWYKDSAIARRATDITIAHRVTTLLEGERPSVDASWSAYLDMQPRYRCYQADKGEMRHLKALGVEAEWQYGKRPFLIFGVNAVKCELRTIDEWKAGPKWQESAPEPKCPQPERFVNRTLPLFA